MSQINSIGSSGGSGNPNVVKVISDTTPAFTSTTAVIPPDNTIPQITEGEEIFSITITPTDASSNLVIEAIVWASNDLGTLTYPIPLALFHDSDVDAIAVGGNMIDNANVNRMTPLLFKYIVSAGSTTARTYSLRTGPTIMGFELFINTTNTGDNVFGAIWQSSFTITEIGPTS